jgi:hypothetical protein
MIYRYYLTGVMGLLLLAAGCTKDQSGTPTAINEIQIDSIKPSYNLLQGARVVIKPVLSFTMDDGKDTSRYEYEWFAADAKRIDLASTRDLDIKINIAPGTHEVYFRVRDRKTGVQWSKKMIMQVRTVLYEGWMLLSDVNGNARLDMISKNDTGYAPIYDVLKVAGSKLKLSGTPVDVACYPYSWTQYGIYVSATGTGTTKIDPETFEWRPEMYLSYETLMKDVPDNYLADKMIVKGAMMSSYLYKNGSAYYYSAVNGFRYSFPVNIAAGEVKEFKVSPYIVSGPADFADYAPTVMYDTEKKRFLQHAPNKTNVSALPEGALFSYNTGMELVFMVSSLFNGSFSGGEVFAILKDPAAPKYRLARFTLDAFGPSFLQNYWEEINAPDFAKAENYAVSPDYGYVFYNVGGKIYEYDIFTKQTKLMLDKGAATITNLKFQRFLNVFTGTANTYKNKLVVGSYDGTANGSLEIFNVPGVNGNLNLVESYAGFGKIKSIAYRERN